MSNVILYDANATDFFNQGLGPLEAKDPKVTEVGNGEFYLELDYPTTGRLFNQLKNGNLIKSDAGHELKDQRFEIKRVVKSMKQGYVSVYAEHISNQALDIALPASVTLSGSAQTALQQAQSNGLGTFKPFTMSSDITTTNSTTLSIKEFKNLKQALGGVEGSILDTWGGEYKFDNYHISLFKKRGRQANAMIAYGRNLVDLEQEENIMNTFTSVYPYAVWRDKEGAEHIIEGSVIHSEHADKYPHHKVLPVDFTLEVEDDTKPTPAILNQLATAYIENNDIGIPEVSIKLTHLDLSKTLDYKEYSEVEKLNVFDEVKIYFADFDINTTAKIVRIVWNVNLERYDEIEVGKVRASLSDRINTIGKQISEARKEAQDARNVSMVAANGVNMVFFGPDEPTATKVGDRWFMEDGQYTISKVWDGVIWRVVNDPRLAAQNKQAIEDQQKIIDEATEKAGQALTAGNQAKELANQAKTAAEKASEVGGQALTAGQQAQELANEVQKAANDAAVVGQQALTAGQEAKTAADNALAAGQAAQALANQAKTDSDTALQKANEGVSTANEAISKANTLTTRIDTVESDYDGLTTIVEGKASSTKVDQLSNQFTVLSTSFNDLEIGGRNLIRRNNEIIGYILSSGNGISPSSLLRTSAYPISVEPNTEYVISGDAYEIWRFAWEDESGNLILHQGVDTRPEIPYKIITSPNNAKKVRVSYPNGTHMKMEKGNKLTDWTPAPEDMATQAQFTLLSDQINLRVEKNDVVRQINVSTEGILIDGGKTHITGETRIDSGVIGTAQIANATINNAKIADLAVTNAKIGNAAISSAKIDDLAVSSAKIANAAITNAKIGSLAVDTANIADAAINNAKIANLAVNEAKIASLAVTNAKIGNAAISEAKIADLAVSTAKIANAAISSAKIGDAAIKTAHIGDAQITTAKIYSLSASKITTGTLNASNVSIINLNANNITSGKLNAIDITGSSITNNFDTVVAQNGTTEIRSLGTITIDGHIEMNGTLTSGGSTNFIIDANQLSAGIYNSDGSVRSFIELTGSGGYFSNGAYDTAITHDGIAFARNHTIIGEVRMQYFSSTGTSAVTISNARDDEPGLRLSQYRIETTNRGGGFTDSPIYLTPSGSGKVHIASESSGTYYGLRTSDLSIYAAGSFQRDTNGRLAIVGSNAVSIGIGYTSSWSDKIRIGTRMNMFQEINMQGYSIINQSDGRFKKNIKDAKVVELDLYRQLKFVTYEYTHKDMAKGRHFGLIAQDAGHLGRYNEDNDKWIIDTSNQTMHNSKAIQELVLLQDRYALQSSDQYKQLTNKLNMLESHLKYRIETRLEKAERRIKQLEEKLEAA